MAQTKKHISQFGYGGPAERRRRGTVALTVTANRWIRKQAKERGWRLVNLWYWEHQLPDDIVPRGALVDLLPNDQHVQRLLQKGCIVVRIGNLPHPGDGDVPAVLPDHAAAGTMAAQHFSEHGFHDVGYFGRDPWSDAQVLYDGFNARAEELGMACHLYRARLRKNESPPDRLRRFNSEFITWIRGLPKPLGFLASGAWQAAMQLAWARHSGISTPDDVAFMSPNNDADICEGTIPTITAVDPDTEGQIVAACELLDRLMVGANAPREPIMIPPKGIIERESTDVLATPDRIVASALRYMWKHLDLDLSIEDVAHEAGMSSRQLARRFQDALGRSFTEELRRKRLEECKHLLRATTLPIADIAPMVGFRSLPYLHRTFREAFGTTPGAFRQNRAR